MNDATRRRGKASRARRISKALREAGLTHEALAQRLGKGRSTISEVVRGRLKSFAVASAIAAALGKHPHDIWPRLYPPPATPMDDATTESTAEPGPQALAS